MFAIWKFPFEIQDLTTVEMPVGARALSTGIQLGEPVVWALVSPSAPKEKRAIRMFGTGHDVPEEVVRLFDFVGTIQVAAGGTVLVFHIWIDRRPSA